MLNAQGARPDFLPPIKHRTKDFPRKGLTPVINLQVLFRGTRIVQWGADCAGTGPPECSTQALIVLGVGQAARRAVL